jgi:hypothetical protein
MPIFGAQSSAVRTNTVRRAISVLIERTGLAMLTDYQGLILN